MFLEAHEFRKDFPQQTHRSYFLPSLWLADWVGQGLSWEQDKNKWSRHVKQHCAAATKKNYLGIKSSFHMYSAVVGGNKYQDEFGLASTSEGVGGF